MTWITRVPATLSDAQATLAHADPQAMASLTEHYRYCELPSIYGGVPQRWVLIYSELRQTQAQRTINKQLRRQSDQEGKAWKKLCRTTFACEADARQALAAFAPTLQATFLAKRIMALLMVMTVCLLVYAALEYRIRQALKEQGATFPNHKGQPVQNPTARWVLHYFVGSHLLLLPGQWPPVLNLTEAHQQLLRLLGKPYERLYR
jgi:transposase